uniref:Transposase n=1 Tax=Candidatus Kentrum sp. TC TaxID=2126339 RepID=A0A451A721_9GAMM|nr:MAG: Transposase [Candidatus Kentron sp. TC]VFK61821.1 MAG: Transposase [Candidatus Kentron sp. TC]
MKTSFRLVLERDEHTRLREALQLTQPLAIAYYMKDDLRRIWQQEDKESAEFPLSNWIERAMVSGVGMLERISTAPLEGANNKIKTLRKMAYGFRDLEFLELKIEALHETKYALVG